MKDAVLFQTLFVVLIKVSDPFVKESSHNVSGSPLLSQWFRLSGYGLSKRVRDGILEPTQKMTFISRKILLFGKMRVELRIKTKFSFIDISTPRITNRMSSKLSH